MKQFISIIIISIIIKGYISACVYADGACTGSIENVLTCTLKEGTEECEEKTACEEKLNPGENDCKNIQTPDPDGTKCVFQSGEPNICVIKKICSTSLEEADCNAAITLTPEKTKCQFDGSCQEIDLCSIASSPSKAVCEAIQVLDSDKQKCIFDSSTTKCVIKTFCDKVTTNFETNCPNAISLDQKKKCVFQTGSSSCSLADLKCTEIEEGSEDICPFLLSETEGKACKYNEANKKCEETDPCKMVKNVENQESCTKTPTTNPITLKCVMKTEGTTKNCDEISKNCSEIKIGGTDDICSKAPVSNEKYKCVLKNGECNEVEKDADTSKSSTTSSTKSSSKSSTKAEEKNGANYAKLSFGLLCLLFF